MNIFEKHEYILKLFMVSNNKTIMRAMPTSWHKCIFQNIFYKFYFTFHHLLFSRFNFNYLFKAVSGLKRRRIWFITDKMICFTGKILPDYSITPQDCQYLMESEIAIQQILQRIAVRPHQLHLDKNYDCTSAHFLL